jgi:hypothetical protein
MASGGGVVSDHHPEMKILTVKWDRSRIPLLYSALQRGVLVKARLGGSIRSLLCEQLGLNPDYVKNRIQTAFLNGKPVDDFDTAVVGEGSVLTLSGALPGLAGATLRKGGFYSSMRASVSYTKEAEKREERAGFITVRIFNILLPELAPVLLAYGIFFSREGFASLLQELSPKDRANCLRGGEREAVSFKSETGGNEGMTENDFIEVRAAE